MDDVDGPAGAGAELEFAQAIRELTLAYVRYRNAVAGRHQVGPSDGAVLARLHLVGPQTPTELARWLGVSTGTVTELLDRLESFEYAYRSPHPTDRRKLIVNLTDRARKVMTEELVEPMTAAVRPALDGFDDPTRRDIVAAVRRATTGLEQAMEEYTDPR